MSRNSLVAQLVEEQAKVIYDNRMREIDQDQTYRRAARQSDVNYEMYKTTPPYLQGKREDALDTIRTYVFGTRDPGTFAYTQQICYMQEFKFQANHAMKIKDYWRWLKEINDYLPYFPPDKVIGGPGVPSAALDDNELNKILDANLPQAFRNICKNIQYNVLAHPIDYALDYLQNVESMVTKTVKCSKSNLCGGS